jgi:energy-coupling factor transporter ATP-binding protein EcfA2
MLRRIVQLEHVGLFHNATPQPLDLQKATLIYGENGRGKSTLCAVLDSCARNRPGLILNRRTIDEPMATPAVQLIFDGGRRQVNFANGAWDAQRPDILVFDAAREATQRERELERAVRTHAEPFDVANFRDLAQQPDAEARLLDLNRQLAAANNANAILRRADLVPGSVEASLSRTAATVRTAVKRWSNRYCWRHTESSLMLLMAS